MSRAERAGNETGVGPPRWPWVVAGLLACIILFLVLVPFGIRWAAVSWLTGQGQTEARIEDVDFNPFTGRLVVSSLGGPDEEGVRIGAQVTNARIDWWPLFQRRVHVAAFSLDDAVVDLWIGKDGTVRVGRMTLVRPGGEGAPEPAVESPWGIGFGALDLRNVRVRLRDPALITDVFIRRLHVDPVRTWEPEAATRFGADLEVNDGRVTLEGTMTPFAKPANVAARITVADYLLGRFRPLVEAAGLADLEGMLGVAGDVTAVVDTETKAVDAGFAGTISLRDLAVSRAADDARLEVAVADLEGTTKVDLGDARTAVHSEMSVSLKELVAVFPVPTATASTSPGPVSTGQAKGREENPAGIEGSSQEGASGEGVGPDQPERPKGYSARQLRFSGTVLWKDLRVDIPAGREPGEDDAAGSTEETGALANRAPGERLAIRADRIAVSGGTSIALRDESVRPAMELTLAPFELEVSGIDTVSADATTRVALRGSVGKYGRVTIEGHGTPIGALEDGAVTARLERIELPPFTGFAERRTGYRIRSGTLSLDTEARVEKGALAAENRLELGRLEVKRLDPTRRGHVETELGIPLDTAINLLRDKDQDIRLTIPVEGNLRDPRFGVGDAVRKALVNGTLKAIQSASLSYFAPVLASLAGPVGAALAAGKLVSLATALRFEPVLFAAGDAELGTESREYLDRLGKLFAERPKLRMQVCGLSVPADAAAVAPREKGKAPAGSGGEGEPEKVPMLRNFNLGPADTKQSPVPDKEAAPPLPEKNLPEEDLRALALRRAETVKDYLMEQAGIDPARLFVCDPEIGSDPATSPRVDLSL